MFCYEHGLYSHRKHEWGYKSVSYAAHRFNFRLVDNNGEYRLLRAAQAALNHQSEECLNLVNAIEGIHIRAANELITSTEILEYLTENITDECSQLARLLGAAQVLSLE